MGHLSDTLGLRLAHGRVLGRNLGLLWLGFGGKFYLFGYLGMFSERQGRKVTTAGNENIVLDCARSSEKYQVLTLSGFEDCVLVSPPPLKRNLTDTNTHLHRDRCPAFNLGAWVSMRPEVV